MGYLCNKKIADVGCGLICRKFSLEDQFFSHDLHADLILIP